jgi:hypothetical protein
VVVPVNLEIKRKEEDQSTKKEKEWDMLEVL